MIPKEFETISEYVCKQTRWTDGSIRHDRMEDVVRCKECKHNPKGIGWVSCPMTGADTRKPDDYCSYGEREGE